jgi:hypothetical protein
MFKVEVDRSKNRITGVLSGYIDKEEALKYAEEWRKAVDSFGGKPFCVINDMRSYKPASSEVAGVFEDLTKYSMSKGMKKIAQIVDESVVSKLQMRRIMKEMYEKGFVDFFREDEKEEIEKFLES